MRARNEKYSFLFFQSGLGILFTVLLTAPSILLLDSHIVGYPHDGFEYIWKMWWIRKSIFDLGINPTSLMYVNYPYEGSNPHLLASPLIPILSIPFQEIFGLLGTYNLFILISLVLSWPACAMLCREFTTQPVSATVGGALYAFNSNKLAHAVGGHLPHVFTFLFPILALLLFRSWRNKNHRIVILFGLILALSLLIDIKHIALFIAPFLTIFLIFYIISDRKEINHVKLRRLFLGFGLAVVITFPFFLPMIRARIRGQLDFYFAPGIYKHSADLLGFFYPPS